MSERPFRVLPRVTSLTEHFWHGGADGQLHILRCQACGTYVHPPAPVCPACLGRDLQPTAVSGNATVHSATVNHQAWNPTMPTPYVVALVELDEQEGLRLVTNIVGCAPEDVTLGMRVAVTFEQHDQVWVPLFAPLGDGT